MNIEKFKRNIQLHKLGIGKLNRKEQKVYNFLANKLKGLCVYKSDKEPNFLYFGKNDDIIVLVYNSNDETLYVDDDEIYTSLEFKTSIQYYDIEPLIRWWVDLVLNLKPKHILPRDIRAWFLLDGAFSFKPKYIPLNKI